MIRQEADLVADVPTTWSRSWPASPGSCASPTPSTSARASRRASRSRAPRPSQPPRCTGPPPRASTGRGPGPVDLETAVDVLGGKIEFESGEEGRETEVLTHLLRTATAETVRGHFRGIDFGLLVQAIESGAMITTGERVTARDFLTGLPVLGESELYDEVRDRPARPTTGSGPVPSSSRSRALPGAQDRQGPDGAETVYG